MYRNIEKAAEQKLNRQLLQSEYDHIAGLDPSGNSDIDVMEYVVLGLMLSEKTDSDEIDALQQRFRLLDEDNSGQLSFDEVNMTAGDFTQGLKSKGPDSKGPGTEDLSKDPEAVNLLVQVPAAEDPPAKDQEVALAAAEAGDLQEVQLHVEDKTKGDLQEVQVHVEDKTKGKVEPLAIEATTKQDGPKVHVPCYKTNIFQAFIIVFVWCSCGTLFYTYWNNWNSGCAFYYAMQVGFSVGFGGDLAEDDEVSRLFSCVYILSGSTAAAVALSFFFEYLEGKRTTIIQDVDNDLQRSAEVLDADGDGVVTCGERCSQKWAALRLSWVRNGATYRVLIAWFLWIWVGIIYSMVGEGWDFMTGWYFSIIAMSTAGLQFPYYAPGPGSSGLEVPLVNGWCIGFYLLVGVPLYGMALGSIASLMMQDFFAKQEELKLRRRVQKEEFDFIASLNEADTEGQDQIDIMEYIVLGIMIKGKTDADEILSFKARFKTLDADGSGGLSFEEVNQSALNFSE